MKLKKALATMMAVALAVSPMTVSASAPLEQPGSQNINVEGGASYVNTTKYKVTLPTNNSLDFTLDPSGIFGYVKDQTDQGNTVTAVDPGDLATFAGKIVGVGSHNIINKSSIPVAVTCDYKLSTTASDISFVTADAPTPATVSGNEINLTVVGGNLTVSGNDYIFDEATGANAFSKGIGTNSTKVMVVLDKTDYQYTVSGNQFGYAPSTVSGANLEETAGLTIGGCISKDHDWSALTGENAKTVKLSCVYSFKGVKTFVQSDLTADGFVKDSADKTQIVYLDGTNAGGSGGSTALTGTYSKATGGPYDTTLGEASKVVMKANPNNSNMSNELNTTTHYTNLNGKCLLKTSWLANLPTGNYVFEVTSGGTTTTVNLTITN